MVILFSDGAASRGVARGWGGGVLYLSTNRATVQPLRPGQDFDVIRQGIAENEAGGPALAFLRVSKHPRIKRSCNSARDG
jgi:hypothetical protein